MMSSRVVCTALFIAGAVIVYTLGTVFMLKSTGPSIIFVSTTINTPNATSSTLNATSSTPNPTRSTVNSSEPTYLDPCMTIQVEELAKSVPLLKPITEVQRDLDGKLALFQGPRPRVIVGLFYGRRRFVRILAPYLQRNLRVHGGCIDQVVFVVKTKNAQDLSYLEQLLASESSYTKVVNTGGFENAYNLFMNITNGSDIVIKLDDDIVFVKDGSFEDIAGTHIDYVVRNLPLKNVVPEAMRLDEHPQVAFVSGNVVNHQSLHFVHHKMGALEAGVRRYDEEAKMLGYSTNETVQTHFQNVIDHDGRSVGGFDFKFSMNGDEWQKLWFTLVQHFSFLEQVSANRSLPTYRFGVFDFNACNCSFCHQRNFHPAKTIHHGYYRWCINAVSLPREYLPDISNLHGAAMDEDRISHRFPGERGLHSIVAGRSLLVHFLYGRQRGAGGREIEDELLRLYEKVMREYTSVPLANAFV